MSIQRAGLHTLLINLCLMVAVPASALTCGEPSPLLDVMGDQYYDASVLPPKPDKVPVFTPAQLFDALENFSVEKGEGEHTKCSGSGKDLKATTVSVTVEDIEIITRNNEVYINASEIHPVDTDNHRENIAISVENRHVTVVNDDELIEIRRQRHASGTGSTFEEVRLTLRRIDVGIDVRQKRYVNGELAEWLHWTLSK